MASAEYLGLTVSVGYVRMTFNVTAANPDGESVTRLMHFNTGRLPLGDWTNWTPHASEIDHARESLIETLTNDLALESEELAMEESE